ncbi:MAG: hypothetical protein AAAC48_07695 [Phyllobacterium sp.]|uniref:hypothetical protein n=1 Tax=Phyllobacterium sp. TaxID=1871046 RepID=UPI0030F18AB2
MQDDKNVRQQGELGRARIAFKARSRVAFGVTSKVKRNTNWAPFDIWTFDRATMNLMVRLPPIGLLFDDILADLTERCWIPIEVQIIGSHPSSLKPPDLRAEKPAPR